MRPSNAEKNYYAILGAAEDASQDEIDRIYKRLAVQHHPDRGGNAEDMKAINEAYRVLRNEATRRAYDIRRQQISKETASATVPPLSPPPAILPNTTLGRFLGALFVLWGGLIFLFLVRIYYIRFMWPLFLLAMFVALFGVWKLHAAMVFARKRLGRSHLLRRHVWVQESAFWSIACLGAYAVYLFINAM
jgi:SAM-dependent methyltransferase